MAKILPSDQPCPRFQPSQFDAKLPRYKNGSNRLGKLKLMDMDAEAYFSQYREKLREELEALLDAA